MTKDLRQRFELWSNKVDRKLMEERSFSDLIIRQERNRRERENGDLLTYVCFNEFFDLDQL